MEIGYGFKPFWFWNGDMRDAEIVRQIEEMAAQGVDGFFIHPRQGLEIGYLSDEWFAKVRVAIDTAKRLDMEVWLYDEYTYPSGVAGGRVQLERPELAARTLEIFVDDIPGGGRVSLDYEWGHILDICAAPLVDGRLDWAGRLCLRDFIGSIYPGQVYQESGLTAYNRKRFFSEGAKWNLAWDAPPGHWRIFMSMEIDFTGFKYFDTFIDPVNPEAVRLFIEHTHEKYRKYFGHEFGKTIKGIFADETMPWGYEHQLPWSRLAPELFKKAEGYELCPVLPALVDDEVDNAAKIRIDFYKTIHDAFIENFDAQIARWCEKYGLISTGEKPIISVEQLKYSHIPGIDAGHHKAGELLPIGGGDRPWFRAMGKVAASAAHWYHDGRAMVEAFHSLGWDANIQDLKYSIDVFAICGVNVIVPHAYFYSTDGMRKHDAPPSTFFQLPQWKFTGDLSRHMLETWDFLQGERIADVLLLDNSMGFFPMSRNDLAKKRQYRQAFADLQEALMLAGLDFYVIGPDMLADADIRRKYKALVVAPMDYIDDNTLADIAKFEAEGGYVERPEFDINAGISRLLARITPAVSLSGDRTLACVYQSGDELRIFALNGEGYSQKAEIKVFGESKGAISFDGYESKFIRYSNGEISYSKQHGDMPELALPIDKPWQMKINQPNSLGLRDWSLALPDGQTAKVAPKPILNQFVEMGLKYAPDYTATFGTSQKPRFPAMDAEFTTTFESEITGTAELFIEPDSILGECEIFVNSEPIGDDMKFDLVIGINTVCVCIKTSETWHGLVNPLYIRGDFGCEPGKIVALPDNGVPFQYLESKLTYYAGDVVYKTAITPPGGDFELTLPAEICAAAEISINGRNLGKCGFSPYRWQVCADMLRPDDNEVALTISTGLAPHFEGEYVNPVTREIVRL